MVKRFNNIIKPIFFEKNTYSSIIFIKKSHFMLNFANFGYKMVLCSKKTV